MTFPLTTLLVLMPSLMVLGAPPGEDIIPIQVQATTFNVTDTSLLGDLLNQPTSGDESLFVRLIGMVADGSATLSGDHHLSVRPGENRTCGADKEIPFPVEYHPLPASTGLLPQAFEYRNCGSGITTRLFLLSDPKGRLYPSSTAGVIEFNNTMEGNLDRWPVSLPDAPADGFLNSPSFIQESTQTSIHTQDTLHHLVSMTQGPVKTGQNTAPSSLTFFKAIPQCPGGPAPKTEDSVPPLLLHALTFQLDAMAGRKMIRERPEQGDAHLLTALLRAVEKGAARLEGHTMLLVEPHGIPIPPNSQPDPFAASPSSAPPDLPPVLPLSGLLPTTRIHPVSNPGVLAEGNRKSSTRSYLDYMFPTEYSDHLFPKSFEFKTLGRTLEVVVVRPTDSTGTRLAIHLDHCQNPVLRSWPEDSPGRGPKVFMPDFSYTQLTTILTIHPGQVSCLGAITLPDSFTGEPVSRPLMQISMLQAMGPKTAAAVATTLLPPELECELISLTEDDAATLARMRASPDEAEAFLDDTLAVGTGRTVGFALLPNPDDAKSGIKAIIEVLSPKKMVRTTAGHLLPTDWYYDETGTSLEIPTQAGTPIPPSTFSHSLAAPARPSVETLSDAAKAGGRVREPLRYTWKLKDPAAASDIQITPPEKIHVPAGHPEEGRWQVSVTRRTTR
ncbi:MAG: hypothetical protein V4675_24915 [Verrucomicrobiota bacterium]